MAYVPRSFAVFQHKSCQISRAVCKPEVHSRSWVHRQQLGIGIQDIREKEKAVGIRNCRSSKTVPGKKTGEWLAGSVDQNWTNTDPLTAIPRIEIAITCRRPAKEYRQQTNANSEVIGKCDEISCPACCRFHRGSGLGRGIQCRGACRAELGISQAHLDSILSQGRVLRNSFFDVSRVELEERQADDLGHFDGWIRRFDILWRAGRIRRDEL